MSAARRYLIARHTSVLKLVRFGIPFETAQSMSAEQRAAWLDAAETMDADATDYEELEDGEGRTGLPSIALRTAATSL